MERTAILVTAVISVALTGLLGFFLIPWLKKLKYGQVILDIGPTWHKSKEGTPTMGGIMMIVGAVFALAVGYISLVLEVPQFLSIQWTAENVRLIAGLVTTLLFSLIGFIDDYTKVVNHRNMGLTVKGKLVLQIIVAAAYLFVMNRYGESTTVFYLPIIGKIDFGIWYYIVSMLLIVGMVNAVNLTDGIDGLAATVTFFYSVCFIIIATLCYYPGTGLFATAVAGCCIGFVIWNFHPAKVFMGDTGSMFLGGAVVTMAYGVSMPVLILIAGIIYLCEAGSVMMQVSYFKMTHGKRIFKMTPIHHHFELSGFSEIKIVLLFSAVTVIGCVLSILAAVNN